VRIEVRIPVSILAQDTTGVQESECPFGYPTSLDILPANRHFLEWSRGDSNPWPPPCKVRVLLSLVFVVVQKYLQTTQFASLMLHRCSPLFVWVGVLLV
jgi:hypothetical protein